jgi:hypothetical protein
MASTRPSEVTNHASGRGNDFLGAGEAVPTAAPNALTVSFMGVHHLPRPHCAAYSPIRTDELARPSYYNFRVGCGLYRAPGEAITYQPAAGVG